MEAKKRRSTTAADASSTRRARSSTHISSLGDDVVGEIFLRLPSLGSIARAACACSHWEAVASSPDFLRRFLGARCCPPLVSYVSPDFSFHPAGGGRDPGLTAFLRRSYISYWLVWDSRHGLLLMTSTNSQWAEGMTVYDPISGRCFTVHRPPPTSEGLLPSTACRPPSAVHLFTIHLRPPPAVHRPAGSVRYFSDCLLPAGDGGSAASFRVVSVQCYKQMIRAAVYDNDTREWTLHPWVAVTPPTGARDSVHASPMHAGRCVYWKYPNQDALLALDTTTMGFAVVLLPPGVSATTPYAIGETQSAECCLVSFIPDPMIEKSQIMQVWVWLRKEGDDQVPFWELRRQVPLLELEQAVPSPRKVDHVRAVAAGVVLVCLNHSDGTTAMEHVAFCLESFKVEAQFKSGQSIIYPYQMMPSVLGKK